MLTFRSLPKLFALTLVAAVGVSCAAIPAKVKRIEFDGQCRCELSKRPLSYLLNLATIDAESADGSHALGHFVERWKLERGAAMTGDVELNDPGSPPRRYRVRFASDGPEANPLQYFDHLSPAVDFRVEKLEVHRRDGIGTPLVAFRENRGVEPIENYYPLEGISRPLTAVFTAKSTPSPTASIRFVSPLQAHKGRTYAADFSVPWAVLLDRTGQLRRAGLGDLLKRKPTRDPQLYLMEPYDPEKEPLIMIHGLLDTPLAWTNVSNELWADDAIRDRYQIWHYLYNTSAPPLYSGRVLRTQLRELRKLLDPSGRDRAMRSTTILAHSMGGLVTRSLITRPGNAFWDAAFTQPIDALTLSDADRKALKEAFFWEPELHVKRAIFIAVPHKGADYADSRVGKIGRWLVKPPNQFTKFYARISKANPDAFTPAYARLGSGKLDSIHALSPQQPTLKIMATLPNSHDVRIHSIIGNNEQPGPLEDSTDGYVPYWSSHWPNAASEAIVNSDHGAIDHDETLVEIKRILTGASR